MKYKYFLPVICCFSALNLSAQLSGGIKAGGNFTNIIGPEAKTNGHTFKPGFHVGVYLEYDFTEQLSIQPEIIFSQKGCKFGSTVTTNFGGITITSEFKGKYNLSYIDIPLLLNVSFGDMGGYIGLGPQVSFLMSPKTVGELNTTTTNTAVTPATSVTTFADISNSDKEDWSPVDFGVVFGTGSKFFSGIEYCLRAGYSFTNTFNPSTSNDVYHNLVFSVSLGYAFGETSGSYSKDKRYKKRRH